MFEEIEEFEEFEDMEEWPEFNIDVQNLRITVEQRQILLDNLDREMNARIERLKQKAEQYAKELKARCEEEINSIPMEIRQMPLDEFISIYHANPKEYFKKQKTAHDAQITPVTKSNCELTWTPCQLDEKIGNNRFELSVQFESEGLPKKRTDRDIIRPIVAEKELNENEIVKSKGSYADDGVSRLRYPEPGERIISLQGTPIFNPFSIFKNENKDNPFIKSLVIPLEGGKVIESPSQIQEIPSGKKREVKDKIMLLQKELDKFSSVLDK